MTGHNDMTAVHLEGAMLALNTLEHFLSNHLARTMACCELMCDDPRLPEDLRGQAQHAMDGARKAVETVRKLRRLTGVRVDPDLNGLQILRLD